MKFFGPRTFVALAVLAHAFVLYWTFKHIIAPDYGSVGLIYRHPDWTHYGAMVALTMAVAFLLPKRLGRPSDVILWIVFTFAAAPSIQFPQYLQLLPVEQASTLGLVVAAGLMIARLIGSLPPLASIIRPPTMSPTSFGIVVVGLAAIIYGTVILSTGLNLNYLSFDTVYGVRAEFVGSTSGNPIVGYGLPVLVNVINPLLMAVGLLRRQYWLLPVGVLGQVVIYTTVGTKNTLFSILFVLAIAPLAHRRASGALIPLGVAIAAAAAALIDLRTRSNGLTVLTTRRVLMVPGALTAAYVSIFSVLPQVHFAELGFGSALVQNTPRLVGTIFVNDSSTAANASLFGHGYAQFGYGGIIIECIVLGIMLRLADWATDGLPTMLAAALFIMPSEAIAEASIFTALLTHGFFAAIVLGALAPRSGWTGPPGKSQGLDCEGVTVSARDVVS